MSDTIFALSSAPGRAGVAVVRVSGPASWKSLKKLISTAPQPPSADNASPSAHNVTLCKIYTLCHPVSRETIDQALVLQFMAPRSFTGEDVIEYHVHGGKAVIDALFDALASQPHHRMAEPGEFTRRAFENGKMDLTEAEAIADLIDAETQIQKAQALAQMAGGLSQIYAGWTEDLKKMLAHMEAEIEFPDEDLPEDILTTMRGQIESLIERINDHLNDNRRGERLRDGLQLAIIGAPNAGKSSLINRLAQRDVAIVSDIAGTTRDVIEVHLDLGGYPFTIADTAGLRPGQLGTEDQDSIESEGIRRALARADQADIKILLFDGTQNAADSDTQALIDKESIVVINKTDQGVPNYMLDGALELSVETGAGFEALLAALISRAEDLIGRHEAPSLTRKRHRAALEEAKSALEKALKAQLPELMAEDCRLAIRALGRITGRVDVEALLDVIFRDFCIGK